MDELQQFIRENFYEINAALAILFLIIYTLLMIHLIHHMRQMVRLKYHTDRRAEFDESRVKIVLIVIFFLFLLYGVTWAFCLLGLDIDREDEYLLANSLFKAVSASMLVGAYVIYFINNRIIGDITHIKKHVSESEDESQNLIHHL